MSNDNESSNTNEITGPKKSMNTWLFSSGIFAFLSLIAMGYNQIGGYKASKQYAAATNNAEKIAALKSEKISIWCGYAAASILLLIILVNIVLVLYQMKKQTGKPTITKPYWIIIIAMTFLLAFSIYSKSQLHHALDEKIDALTSKKDEPSDINQQITTDTTNASSSTCFFLLILMIAFMCKIVGNTRGDSPLERWGLWNMFQVFGTIFSAMLQSS